MLITSFFSSNVAGIISTRLNSNANSNILPGDHYNLFFVDGRLRSYRIHIPQSYDHNQPVPLVLVLHGSGFGANSFSVKNNVEMDSKADEEGFITVYPNGELLLYQKYYNHPISFFKDIFAITGIAREWNRWDDNDIDDVNYIERLINHLKRTLNINNSRIYVTGMSGGAMMTYRLGAELSDQIAAIAPVAGTIGGIGYVNEPNNNLTPYIIPDPSNPIPVLALNGKNDISVPLEGGWKKVFEWNNDELWVYTVSINTSISFWVEHNNCSPTPNISYSNSKNTIFYTYEDNQNNNDVEFILYVEGGHEWFKTPKYELSATDLIWDFFEKHPKK